MKTTFVLYFFDCSHGDPGTSNWYARTEHGWRYTTKSEEAHRFLTRELAARRRNDFGANNIWEIRPRIRPMNPSEELHP